MSSSESALGPSSPRVTIAHDFACAFGGAERIIATAAERLPDADFWAIVGRSEVAERMGVGDRIRFLLPESEFLAKRYRALTPLYPAIVRARPLPDADVLLTSSYAFAHGMRTQNHAPQVCYCYSPLRFAWTMTDAYGRKLQGGRATQLGLRALAAALRSADRRAAERVSVYLAESRFVADQIRRFYGRESEVVYPPVDCERFRPADDGKHDDFFLFCGRLIEPYKRPGLVVDAFAKLDARVVIAGDGPAAADLRQRAPSNVEFVGELADEELIPLMQRCAAVIFPSADDFGLIPVEVMACGRPVIAFAGGGALETVLPGETGEFFASQEVEALRAAVSSFDPEAYESAAIRAHAEGFRRERFQDAIEAAVLGAASA